MYCAYEDILDTESLIHVKNIDQLTRSNPGSKTAHFLEWIQRYSVFTVRGRELLEKFPLVSIVLDYLRIPPLLILMQDC